MSGYLSSGAVEPLVATGALLTMARRRIAETGKYLRDIATSGTIERSSEGFKTTVRVRIMHAMIRRRLGASAGWKTDDWGVPVNQRDMVGTNLEFSIAYIGGLTALGYRISRREREALVRLSRIRRAPRRRARGSPADHLRRGPRARVDVRHDRAGAG